MYFKQVKFLSIILFLWSIVNFYFLSQALEGGSIEGVFGYLPVILALILELTSLFLILKNAKYIFKSRLNQLIFLWLIYVIINTFLNSNSLFLDLREVTWWPLIYFLFYCIVLFDISKRQEEFLYKWVPLLLVILFLLYLNITYENLNRTLFFNLNHVFYISLLLPFSFLIKKQYLKNIFIFICFLAVLLSFKRSAILYSILILLLYFNFLFFNNKNIFKKVTLIVIITITTISTFNYVNDLAGGYILDRFSAVQEDGGSGRLEIYEAVLGRYNAAFTENKIFGFGHNAVRKAQITGDEESLSAHNDFLEILFDFGVVGIFLYTLIIFSLVKRITRVKKKLEINYYYAFISSLIIFFIMSFVSHLVLYPTYFAYIVIVWAIIEANLHRKRSY